MGQAILELGVPTIGIGKILNRDLLSRMHPNFNMFNKDTNFGMGEILSNFDTIWLRFLILYLESRN